MRPERALILISGLLAGLLGQTAQARDLFMLTPRTVMRQAEREKMSEMTKLSRSYSAPLASNSLSIINVMTADKAAMPPSSELAPPMSGDSIVSADPVFVFNTNGLVQPPSADIAILTASSNDSASDEASNLPGERPNSAAGDLNGVPCGALQERSDTTTFWNLQANHAITALPEGATTENEALSLSDRPEQLGPIGPARAWCRPQPASFIDSSPLASRSFWVPVLILIFGCLAFWMTRGSELPS
jgi:hypothetical protein